MKFSLLIANYNNEDFFRDCYDSILKQDYDNWEAVILDDGSNPGSLNKIKEMVGEDSRFKFFENEVNQGVGVTKSRLIDLATGDICGFLDPDDAILPNAISSAIKVYEEDKDVVLTYSRFVTCDENLQPLHPFKSAQQIPNQSKEFFNYPIQIAHFVTFKKSAYEKTMGMNSNLKIAEDQDLYLKLYEVGKVKFIPSENYLYRTHQGGISQNEHKEKSYQYFGQVIFDAMKRRGLNTINGKKIPDYYSGYEEIFDLLNYQNSVPFRIMKKLKIFLEKF